MSGIYIPGMEMPIRCGGCPCADLEYYDCNLMPGTRIEFEKRLPNCPLIPVPPHGRLIDADALRYWSDDSAMIAFDYVTRSQINAAPTIIPAEEVEG